MIFLMDFRYSVNDEKFYYTSLTEGGDEHEICLTREQHEKHQYNLECDMWRKTDA